MKFLNWTFGSFFRTLGRIFAYISIGLAIAYFSGFLNIGIVKAETYDFNFLSPTSFSVYDQYADHTEEMNADAVQDSIWKIISKDSGSFGTGTYGISEVACGIPLFAGNHYTYTIYHIDFVGGRYLHPSYSSYSSKFGLGRGPTQALANSNSASIQTAMYYENIGVNGARVYLGSVSFTFQATNNNDRCIRTTMSTSTTKTWELGELFFAGYTLEDHGSVAPTVDEINEALSENFDEVISNISNSTNSINNNINNATNSINQNIDEMTDKVDNSLNSEDSDVTSKKCGVVCKLKGIFTGIANLPSNIWNSLKGGFEAITSGITNLISNITSEDGPELEGLNSSAGWLPAGPIDSILNLPLSLLNNVSTNLSKTCQPVNLVLPFIKVNFQLPCINTIYSQIEGLSALLTTIGVITSGFILFYYLMNLYKWVDDTLTFRENNYLDNWGGV